MLCRLELMPWSRLSGRGQGRRTHCVPGADRGAHVSASASAGTDTDGFLGEAECAQALPFTVRSAPFTGSLRHWRLSTACEMSRYGTVPADTPANGSIGPVPCSANSQPRVLPIAASVSSDDVRSYLYISQLLTLNGQEVSSHLSPP